MFMTPEEYHLRELRTKDYFNDNPYELYYEEFDSFDNTVYYVERDNNVYEECFYIDEYTYVYCYLKWDDNYQFINIIVK